MTHNYCGICRNKINLWETIYFLKNGIICDNCAAKTQLSEKIKRKKEELEELDAKLNNQLNKTTQLSATINTLLAKIAVLNNQIIDLSDEITYESYGLYKPHYNFSNSGTYKGKLSEVRATQKEVIRSNTAGIIFNPLTMDGSLSKGKSMQKKNIKQLIWSFNGEREAAINKVTKSNIETNRKENKRFLYTIKQVK